MAPTPTASSSSPAVADCYLAILLDQPVAELAPELGSVFVVPPAPLLHSGIPQPDGQVLYELVTGHPDRAPRDLVFLADLTLELHAWPQQTWTAVGISPEAAPAGRGGPLARRARQGPGVRWGECRGGRCAIVGWL